MLLDFTVFLINWLSWPQREKLPNIAGQSLIKRLRDGITEALKPLKPQALKRAEIDLTWGHLCLVPTAKRNRIHWWGCLSFSVYSEIFQHTKSPEQKHQQQYKMLAQIPRNFSSTSTPIHSKGKGRQGLSFSFGLTLQAPQQRGVNVSWFCNSWKAPRCSSQIKQAVDCLLPLTEVTFSRWAPALANPWGLSTREFGQGTAKRLQEAFASFTPADVRINLSRWTKNVQTLPDKQHTNRQHCS